ncbi:hypothetical protein K438DRAFT_1999652 [Mycena galopus ATCC 62051]|nr:hypothetical protein K438DRAFT_1999652 [Mycena galopus ATCC 62051]
MQLALAVSQEWAEAREEGGVGEGEVLLLRTQEPRNVLEKETADALEGTSILEIGVASNPYARPANADAVLAAAAAALDREDGETDIGGDDEEDDEMPVQETPKKKRRRRGATGLSLDGLEQSPGAINFEAPEDLRAVVQRLDLLQLNAHVNSFWYMVALVQLAMHVHRQKHVPGAQKLAEEYGYSSTTFKRRLESGTRLAALCAAFVIAVAGMQLDFISDKKSAKQDIIALCSAFREISHDKWGVLIQRLRIPLEYIRQNSNFLASLNFCYRVPIEAEGVPEVIQSVPFHSLIETDEIMEQINTNCPPRSRSWYEPVEQWELPTDPGEVPTPEIRTIRTPEPLAKAPSPVSLKTTEAFTEEQRKVAQEADIALNLDDLEDLLKDPNREAYIRIDGDILDGNALRLEDSEGKMLSDYFKLPPYLVRKVQDAIALVQAAMPGKWKTDESIRLLDMRLLRTLTIWIMSNEIMGAGSISVNVYRMNQKTSLNDHKNLTYSPMRIMRFLSTSVLL